jgi:hypothetical protein
MINKNKHQKINQNNIFIFQKLKNVDNITHNNINTNNNNNNQIYTFDKSTILYILKDILINKNIKDNKKNNIKNKNSLKKNKK